MSLLSFDSFLLETKFCATLQTRFGGINGHIIQVQKHICMLLLSQDMLKAQRFERFLPHYVFI